MFEIDENNLPFVRTRQALLVLDLQNEFLAPEAALPVREPPEFTDNILKLLPEFRSSGNVIWIRSIFKGSRPYNEPGNNSEKIVTDEELPLPQEHNGRSRPSDRIRERYGKMIAASMEATDAESFLGEGGGRGIALEEAFLSIGPGGQPRYVLPESPTANIAATVAADYDLSRDIMIQKSHYSAFRDGSLVQTLRSRFIMELYICGSLTNISVYATAMDAAQFGYAITIVDDCLGYRSKARHDEALRRLVDSTGCDVMSSTEIIRDIKQKAKMAQKQPAPRPRPLPSKQREKKVREPELESLMSKLNLRPEATSSDIRSRSPSSHQPVVATEPISANNGSFESLLDESQEFDMPVLPPRRTSEDTEKPDRVKSKIKTRRRPSKTASKDSSSSKPSPVKDERVVSPTMSTLQGASSRLETVTEKTIQPKVVSNGMKSALTADVQPTAAIEVKKGASEDSTQGVVKDAQPLEPTLDNEVDEVGAVPTTDAAATICEGDTLIIENVLEASQSKDIFERIRDEVLWQKMSHQGGDVPRLVAVQGSIADDGSIPIYRHPADESPPLLPFSPNVLMIKSQAEKHLGHSLNHVLIQFYRDGSDHISEHSDKTLDIVPDTFIVNVSLGAQRTMVFRTKRLPVESKSVEAIEQPKPRQAVRAPLPHNSMCRMGLKTNMRWLHAIRPDKRLASEKSDAELAYDGARISLTFRHIGTFLSKDQQKIWGQGATSKTRDQAQSVINGNAAEAEKMIRAFGKENHSSEFNWDFFYGRGFDVLHIDNTPKLFLSGDTVANMRVKLFLAVYDIAWVEGKLSPAFNWKQKSQNSGGPPVKETLPVRYIDSDLGRSVVTGDFAILLYLDAVYGARPKSNADMAMQFTRLQQFCDLQSEWSVESATSGAFIEKLMLWDTFAGESEHIAGKEASLVDWLLFPLLEEIYQESGLLRLDNLERYYNNMRRKERVVKLLGTKEELEITAEHDKASKEG